MHRTVDCKNRGLRARLLNGPNLSARSANPEGAVADSRRYFNCRRAMGMSASANVEPKADRLQAFRVSDAVRRRKVFDARTAGVIG
jgi:hypothetical protein